jgi:hypothetical protein
MIYFIFHPMCNFFPRYQNVYKFKLPPSRLPKKRHNTGKINKTEGKRQGVKWTKTLTDPAKTR